jgi:hypothetical protein
MELHFSPLKNVILFLSEPLDKNCTDTEAAQRIFTAPDPAPNSANAM